MVSFLEINSIKFLFPSKYSTNFWSFESSCWRSCLINWMNINGWYSQNLKTNEELRSNWFKDLIDHRDKRSTIWSRSQNGRRFPSILNSSWLCVEVNRQDKSEKNEQDRRRFGSCFRCFNIRCFKLKRRRKKKDH